MRMVKYLIIVWQICKLMNIFVIIKSYSFSNIHYSKENIRIFQYSSHNEMGPKYALYANPFDYFGRYVREQNGITLPLTFGQI